MGLLDVFPKFLKLKFFKPLRTQNLQDQRQIAERIKNEPLENTKAAPRKQTKGSKGKGRGKGRRPDFTGRRGKGGGARYAEYPDNSGL